MSITLSESAAQQIRDCLASRGRGLGVRLVAESSECSGFSYRISFVDQPDVHDAVFTCHGTNVYVDHRSLFFLDGTDVDFVTVGQQSGFVLNNPNVRERCGCGRSFYV
jgi:iron-sulfur cluster assembly protein